MHIDPSCIYEDTSYYIIYIQTTRCIFYFVVASYGRNFVIFTPYGGVGLFFALKFWDTRRPQKKVPFAEIEEKDVNTKGKAEMSTHVINIQLLVKRKEKEGVVPAGMLSICGRVLSTIYIMSLYTSRRVLKSPEPTRPGVLLALLVLLWRLRKFY